MAYWYSKHQSYFLWLDFSKRDFVILSSVLLGLSLLPLRGEASPPVVWTMMFMLWHVFINSEGLSSATSSSTLMNANFLSWFINVVTINSRVSRCGRLLLDGNPKGWKVAYHIAKTFEVNPWMLLTLKNAKFISSMNPGANFETSEVGPLDILVALFRRKIGQGSSNSGRFLEDLPWVLFLPFA